MPDRLALRILQNRAGLVPRPSWCTFTPRAEGVTELPPEQLREVFACLGELDLVRLAGSEPLERADLDEVAEVILEASRPRILHLWTSGQLPERAEDFARGLSRGRRLRVLVELPKNPTRTGSFEAHRRFALALETLERLRVVARDRAFKVGALARLHPDSTAAEVQRLRMRVEALGVSFHSTAGAVGPEAELPRAESLSERVTEALAYVDGRSGRWARMGERYFLEGTAQRLAGQRRLQPRCTSLRSHVRLGPDGRVPVCGHLSGSVGSLAEGRFDDVWFGPEAERARQRVDGCSGCWDPEEVLPSALYSGDIVRARRRERRPDGGAGRRRARG